MRSVYNTIMKVRLMSGHPQFFKGQYGVLKIFLVDDSPDEAMRRAVTIAEQLQYEVIQTPLHLLVEELLQEEPFAALFEQASREGFAMRADIFHQNVMNEEKFLAIPLGSSQ